MEIIVKIVHTSSLIRFFTIVFSMAISEIEAVRRRNAWAESPNIRANRNGNDIIMYGAESVR